MAELIFFLVAFCSVAGVLATVWWLTSRPKIGPYEMVMARMDKVEALIETGDLWHQIGDNEEAQKCYLEAQRLTLEIHDIMSGNQT